MLMPLVKSFHDGVFTTTVISVLTVTVVGVLTIIFIFLWFRIKSKKLRFRYAHSVSTATIMSWPLVLKVRHDILGNQANFMS